MKKVAVLCSKRHQAELVRRGPAETCFDESRLAASSAPEGESKDGDENRGDSGNRSIVSVKEGYEIGSDPAQAAEARHFVSGIIFIIGSGIALIWLCWHMWRDRF